MFSGDREMVHWKQIGQKAGKIQGNFIYRFITKISDLARTSQKRLRWRALYQPLTFPAKLSILDVCWDPCHVFGFH